MNWDQVRALHREVNKLSVQNDWTLLANVFFNLVETLSGTAIARKIWSTNLSTYSDSLRELLGKGVQKVMAHPAKAI